MRKFYSLVLIAAGLLIGTQVWAENVCKIGTTDYEDLQTAIDAASTTVGEFTTITMIADVDAVFNTPKLGLYTIDGGKQIVWDLNGKKINVHTQVGATSGNYTCIEITGASTYVQIIDSKEGGKQGQFIYTNESGTNLGNGCAELIRVTNGTLVIKGGYFEVATPQDNQPDGGYCVDVCTQANNAHALCIIENGEFHNTWDCVRTYAQNGTNAIAELSVKGGRFFGENGIFFEQAQKDNQKSIITIAGCYAECENKENGLVRVWTSGPGQMDGMVVNISGAEANVSALKIQHMQGTASINGENVSYDDLTEEEIKQLEATLEQKVNEFEEKYKTVFNISGGTFLNDSYIIMSGIMQTKDEDGNLSFAPAENGTPVFTNYKLPTLLEGIYCDEETHILPGGQDAYPDEITVVPVHFSTPSDGDFMQDEKEGAKVTENLNITGTENKAYSLIVENNATVTVKDGAILTIGQGGITVENGSHIIVEAGGILKVGDRGFEGKGADALIVYSNPTASGVVMMSPNAYLNDAPELTIRMKSNAYTNPNNANEFYWQFFAIPTRNACNLDWDDEISPSYMKKYNIATQSWTGVVNASEFNTPFIGYAITNDCASRGEMEYTMHGEMVGRKNAVLALTTGGETGWNLFGNSYLAPIDVDALLSDIKMSEEEIASVVYAYNSYKGQYVYSTKTIKGDVVNENNETSPFTSIPPMNAFFMKYNGSSSAAFTIDYQHTVFEKVNTKPMMVSARTNTNVTKIHVEGGNNCDNLYFVANADESENVSKMMNDRLNLYAIVGEQKQAGVSTNDLSNMQLGFIAGDAIEYTMTFSNANDYVLVDNLTNAQVAMTDGATYTFVATPNETTENRFEIRKAGGVVTNLAEIKAAHAVKGIYTAAGQYVGKADRWNTLPAGMYIVDGVRMAK